MKKLKNLLYIIKNLLSGKSIDFIMYSLAYTNRITFDEYDKFVDKRIKKGKREDLKNER